MSEHMSIEGEVQYWHLALGEKGGLTFCNHCKKTCNKVIVNLHEGFSGNWMTVECGRCKKNIWASQINMDIIKDDKKCFICKKPTNHYDCNCEQFSTTYKGMRIFCSKKCYNKANK